MDDNSILINLRGKLRETPNGSHIVEFSSWDRDLGFADGTTQSHIDKAIDSLKDELVLDRGLRTEDVMELRKSPRGSRLVRS